MPNSQRENGTGNKTYYAVYPIGYPAILCMFSYIMWTMYSCGLLLKSIGFSTKTWIAKTYHNFGVKLKGRTLRKPPEVKNKKLNNRKMLMMGLAAALSIANSIPRIETSQAKVLRNQLRQFKHSGILKTSKLKGKLLDQVRGALKELPTELLHEGQVLPIICDTGCSKTCVGFKNDFKPGSLVPLEYPLPMDGVAGTLFATHKGILQYELLNDEEGLTTLETQSLYVPK